MTTLRLRAPGLVLVLLTLLLAVADGRRRDGRGATGGGGAPRGFGAPQPQPYGGYETAPSYPEPPSAAAAGASRDFLGDGYPESASGRSGGDQRFSGRGGVGSGAADTGDGGSSVDVVPSYTKTLLAKSLVAATSALSSSLLFFWTSKLVFSKASLFVSLLLASVCSASCFATGDLAAFSKALGVFTLLISRRTKPGNFVFQLLKSLRSLLLLSTRHPFPATDNPWKFSDAPRSGAPIPFSMTNVMIGVVVTGFFMGWSVSKLIPFFPGWLGSIGCAVVFGYQCTLQDAKGDLFRYLGYAVNALFSEVTATIDDVMLREKTSVLLGKIFAFVHRLDQNYHLLDKIKAILSVVISKLTSMASLVR